MRIKSIFADKGCVYEKIWVFVFTINPAVGTSKMYAERNYERNATYYIGFNNGINNGKF